MQQVISASILIPITLNTSSTAFAKPASTFPKLEQLRTRRVQQSQPLRGSTPELSPFQGLRAPTKVSGSPCSPSSRSAQARRSPRWPMGWVKRLSPGSRASPPARHCTQLRGTGTTREGRMSQRLPTSSACTSSQAGADVRTACHELGARYVMEGSLRQAGAKLRLSFQLVDGITGAHLWAENYERAFSPDAFFELQDDLVPRIVSTVADPQGTLPRSMSEILRTRNPSDLSPYEAVLRSFAHFQRVNAEEHAASRAALEHAVEVQPGYADAWAM